MAGKKGKVDDIMERRIHLCKVITEFNDKGIRPTRQMLLKRMRDDGYNISNDTLHRDWVHEMRSNTFLRDLGESTLSHYIEEVFADIDSMKEYFYKWMENPPTIKEQTNVPRLDKKGNIMTDNKGNMLYTIEKQIVETISPITIMEILAKSVQLRIAVLKGDIVNTAWAMLADNFDELKKKVEAQAKELEQYKNEPTKQRDSLEKDWK
jgi:hypothetical protein